MRGSPSNAELLAKLTDSFSAQSNFGEAEKVFLQVMALPVIPATADRPATPSKAELDLEKELNGSVRKHDWKQTDKQFTTENVESMHLN